jgi:hypothetical protein
MKRTVLIVLLIATVLASILNEVIRAQETSPPTAATNSPRESKTTNDKAYDNQSIEQQRLDFERQKFISDTNLEKEKIQLERDKQKVEQSKIPWTAFSTIVPLLAVLVTVVYSAWSFRKQTGQQNEQRIDDAKRLEEQRVEDAKLQFELKAAEIAFMGETPLAVRDRAKALKTMFGDRLRDDFLSSYDPYEFGEKEGNIESKKFFLDLLLKYPDQQFETLCFWKELFPGDVNWLVRVHLSPHEIKTKLLLEEGITPQTDTTEQHSTVIPRSAESDGQIPPESNLTKISNLNDSTIDIESSKVED